MFKPLTSNRKYITYDEKPIYEADYQARSNALYKTPVLTIVMQGPIKHEEDFTYETLKLYKRTFPGCPLILSTWKSEKADTVEKIKQLGVLVLLNDPPSVKGLWNINKQIVSTYKGLEFAKAQGAEFVIKTRTDQRFYETNIPEFLFNIIRLFPAQDPQIQKSRLVCLSFNTFKYRLYDISDMFFFGHIDEVLRFWSCDFETRESFPSFTNVLEYAKLQPSEIYFTVEYLKKLGHNLTWTLKDSWAAYTNYFCIIDASSLGFYWPKYSSLIDCWRNFLGVNPELEEFTFKEWLNLYFGLDNQNTEIPEQKIRGSVWWPQENILPQGEYRLFAKKLSLGLCVKWLWQNLKDKMRKRSS